MIEGIQKAQRPEDCGDPGRSPLPLLCFRCGADIDAPAARVGLGYRALAVLDGDVAAWFWIGTHADYDRLLRSL